MSLVNCPPRESMLCIGSWHIFASLEEIVLGGGCMAHAKKLPKTLGPKGGV